MTNTFDVYFYKLINQTLVHEGLDYLMVSFSDKTFWIPFYCVVVWFMSKQYGKMTLLILLFTGLSVLASDRLTSGLMKPAFNRPRPCKVAELNPRLPKGIYCSDSGSMASSHAANHFAVAVFIILLFRDQKSKRLNTVFWLSWAAVIAYSRVYCGVHYPTDVIVGSGIGAIIGAISYYLYVKALNRTKWK